MNTEYEIRAVVDDQTTAVGPLRRDTADQLSTLLGSLDVEHYVYARAGTFDVWRFERAAA